MKEEYDGCPCFNMMHCNKDGYLAEHKNDGTYRLAFGNITMDIDQALLRDWYQKICELVNHYEKRICPVQKAFVFNTSSGHVKMVYSWLELNSLADLLSPVMLILDARQIVAGNDEDQ